MRCTCGGNRLYPCEKHEQEDAAHEALIEEREEAVGDICFLLNCLGWRKDDEDYVDGECFLCPDCKTKNCDRIGTQHFDRDISTIDEPDLTVECTACDECLEYDLPT